MELYKAMQRVSYEPMQTWQNEKFSLILFRTYIIKELFPLVESRQDVFDPPEVWGWHSYRSLGIKRKQQDDINLSMEIKFNPNWDRAVVTIRVGEYNGNEEKIIQDDNFKIFKQKMQELVSKCTFFKKHNGEYCIGKEKKEEIEKLKYSNDSSKLTEEIKQLVAEFAQLCKATNDLLANEPIWKNVTFKKRN